MVFDGILLSFIVGFLRKGSIRGLASLKFKWGWMFPILLVIEILVFVFQNDSRLLGQASSAIFMLIYVVGMLFLILNRKQPGFLIILIGVFLNFLVMALNGGRMPVSAEAASVLDPGYLDVLKEHLYAKHTLLTKSTSLGFLGDIIPLSKPYPRTQIISIGDVIMNIGAFLFIQYIMVHLPQKNKVDETNLHLKGGEVR